ncbi:MAG: hypothetical protein Q7J27_07245, partial [Syntrophales bacterium]|nr:hypothetical protein [Syntrophales bacterium]
ANRFFLIDGCILFIMSFVDILSKKVRSLLSLPKNRQSTEQTLQGIIFYDKIIYLPLCSPVRKGTTRSLSHAKTRLSFDQQRSGSEENHRSKKDRSTSGNFDKLQDLINTIFWENKGTSSMQTLTQK